jgi:hypothetical protein
LVAFDEGLSIAFVTGAAPSFAAGDMFSFRALQPWAVSNIKTPGVEPWKWAAESIGPTLEFDLGASQDWDMVALALHSIPEGATITIEGGGAPGSYDWSEEITWREGVIAHALAQTRTDRYGRLTLADAPDGGIGWLWVGAAFATGLSADVTPVRKYSISRGDGGLYQRGRYLGKGRGAEVVWTEGALNEDDIAGLEALVEWVKQQDDEPLVFVANVTRLEEAALVQVTEDEFDEPDTSSGNRDAAFERRFNAALTLAPVLQ